MEKKLLVTTQELAAHLDDPQWVVFDTRHDLMDAEKGRTALVAALAEARRGSRVLFEETLASCAAAWPAR